MLATAATARTPTRLGLLRRDRVHPMRQIVPERDPESAPGGECGRTVREWAAVHRQNGCQRLDGTYFDTLRSVMNGLHAASRHPLVSIITPVLNRVDTINEALTSVARQTYRPIEHLIVDGGSTDGTIRAIE